MDVFHDLLAAFDITPEDAEQLDSPLGNYRPQGSAIPPEDYYVELSAYGLSVEVPNAEFCGRMHHALAEHYGFTEEQLAWFTMHAALDADHGEEFRKYVGHAARTPGGLTRLREKTLVLAEATKQVWDGFGRWR
jgi:pyrroloquinoline quinone (PQQ) biosynthesis protein C